MTEISVPVLVGSEFELNKLDFSFKDIIILDIQSKEFEDYIANLQPDSGDYNFNFFREIIEEAHSFREKRYAIVKNEPRKEYNDKDIFNVYKFLLILFPSDLQIEFVVKYYYENDYILNAYMNSWERRYTGSFPGEPLIALDEYITEINEFARFYFDRLNVENYIGITIENYITSFSASHIHYQYLTLCIALESVINGNQELTYRLRRTITVLCGNDLFSCEIIYKNLGKLYDLRSKIIHGEEYGIEKVIEYLAPLRAIVSRTIIELLIHNVPTNKVLNEIITQLGFGERSKISEKWKHYELNITTIVDTNWRTLT